MSTTDTSPMRTSSKNFLKRTSKENTNEASSSASPNEIHMFENLENYTIPKGNGKEVQSKVFRQNTRHANGGWKFIDEPELKKQRGVIWALVKNVGQSIVSGQELVNTCLPIQLFEPRSFLEKLSDTWAYAPLYLNKAAEAKDPLERMKLIAAFCVSGLHLTQTLTKPFNPLLGETFQGNLGEDIQVFCEQTSHHPPISNWQVIGKRFHYYGHGIWSASCLGNIVKGYQKGPHHIEFDDGCKIYWTLPDILIKGIFFGDRITEFNGKIHFIDEKNKLVCEMRFNPYAMGFFKGLISKQKESNDLFTGQIYRVSEIPKKEKDFKFKDSDSVAKIEGTWLTNLTIDSTQYWNLSMVPSGVTYEENPLPSDCRYRLDLSYLKQGDVDQAKIYKAQIEDNQRTEAKFRKDSNKKPK